MSGRARRSWPPERLSPELTPRAQRRRGSPRRDPSGPPAKRLLASSGGRPGRNPRQRRSPPEGVPPAAGALSPSGRRGTIVAAAVPPGDVPVGGRAHRVRGEAAGTGRAGVAAGGPVHAAYTSEASGGSGVRSAGRGLEAQGPSVSVPTAASSRMRSGVVSARDDDVSGGRRSGVRRRPGVAVPGVPATAGSAARSEGELFGSAAEGLSGPCQPSGTLCLTFSMAVGGGVSYFQYANIDSGRNIFIVGFTMFMALLVPRWLDAMPAKMDTGWPAVDMLLLSLLTSPIFLGGLLSFILDNTVEGTLKERGLHESISLWPSTFGENTLRGQEEQLANAYSLPPVVACFFPTVYPFNQLCPPPSETEVITVGEDHKLLPVREPVTDGEQA